jgi:hypothetical protein
VSRNCHQDSTLNVATVVPTSKVRTIVIFVLLLNECFMLMIINNQCSLVDSKLSINKSTLCIKSCQPAARVLLMARSALGSGTPPYEVSIETD